MLLRELRDLQAAELVEIDDRLQADPYAPPDGHIRLGRRWKEVQAALGLSLSKNAALEESDSMVVAPIFGTPRKQARRDVFVIMPFTAELQPVYADHVRPVVERLGLTVARADDLFTTHAVVTDIWSSILGCKLVIADCTGRNANVFYELGIAHTVGKRVVLLTQSADDVPFDIRHIRYLRYSYTPPGMRELEQALHTTISAAVDR